MHIIHPIQEFKKNHTNAMCSVPAAFMIEEWKKKQRVEVLA